MQQPVWIEKEETLLGHSRQLAEHSGSDGVRDEGLLESALARAKNTLAYEENVDLFDLAASYAFGIARNHPFVDGNKRTTLSVCETFLYLNGYRAISEKQEKYVMYLWLAEGKLSEGEFANWLREKAKPVA